MIITATSRSNSSAKVRSVQCLFCRFWRTKTIFGLLFLEGKEGRGQNDIRHVWFSRSEKKEKPLWFSAAAFSWQSAVSIFRFPIKIVGRELEARAILALFSADRKIIMPSSIWENIVLLFRGLEGSFLREVILVVKGGGVERYIAFVAKTFITKSRPFKNMQEMF